MLSCYSLLALLLSLLSGEKLSKTDAKVKFPVDGLRQSSTFKDLSMSFYLWGTLK